MCAVHDVTFTDLEYHKAFPIIYHLRNELLKDASPHDPRLVYLAMHHILKHRGHFIFEGQDFTEGTDFSRTFAHFLEVWEEFGVHFDLVKQTWVEALMKDENATISDKKKGVFPLLFGTLPKKGHKKEESLANLLSGGNCNLTELFDEPLLGESAFGKISL